METRMLLILILAGVTLAVGLCLIGFAVKAAKKDSVWEQVEEAAPRAVKREPQGEEWHGAAAPNEGLRARATAAGAEHRDI